MLCVFKYTKLPHTYILIYSYLPLATDGNNIEILLKLKYEIVCRKLYFGNINKMHENYHYNMLYNIT